MHPGSDIFGARTLAVVVDDDVETPLRKQHRGGRTDAARGAGDQNYVVPGCAQICILA